MMNRARPILCPSRFYPILLIVGLFLMITTLLVHDGNISRNTDVWKSKSIPELFRSKFSPYVNLTQYTVKTHKGLVTLEELNNNVFKKFGYEIDKPTLPVPTLRMVQEPSCDSVFSEWERISNEPQPEFPPKEIPKDRVDDFLLYGYAALSPRYINDKNSAKGEKPRNWDKISEMIKWPKDKLGGQAYSTDGVSMFNAMKSMRLDGMSGFVVGSMQPWVEVSALVNGASKVLTVEYNKLTIQPEFSDRMSSILPIDFVKNWEKYAGTFDFAASFSSIEHSGLGRYGDPVDPIGDFREMLKIKCMLKPGGLMFLGFPLGTDAIQYNAHRIYGSVRLAFMFYGFEWVGTYSGQSEEPYDLNSENLHSRGLYNMFQHTVVLRKL